MPDRRYEASRQTVGAFLSTTSPGPKFRNGSGRIQWTTEQVEAFWHDLVSFDKRYPGDNALGEEYFLGSIVLVTGGTTNLLLDGQQRLATATILLAALRDARREYSGDAAARLQSRYIADFDDATSTTSLVLTLNVYDREFFRAEIQDQPQDPPLTLRPTLRSHGLVRKARRYFSERIAEASAELGVEMRLFNGTSALERYCAITMSIVAVTCTDEDNAASIFETLNDRGIGLSTPDLLRNLLLGRAPDSATQGGVVVAWEAVLALNADPSVDEFLRHYWISIRGDVKSRKLYREIKTTILDEDIPSIRLSLELAEAAPAYADIVRAQVDDPELRQLLEGIRALGAKALYPALLSGSVAEGDEGKHNLRMLARALSALFIRYNVIGGRETTVMEAAVYDAAATLRKSKDFQAAVGSLAELTPDGSDFVQALPGCQRQSDAYGPIPTARDRAREATDARGLGWRHGSSTCRAHIPKNADRRQVTLSSQSINRLGKLTLLGKRLNTSIKNADFSTKAANGYADSDLLMTKELLERDVWDSHAIDERQRELSTWIFDIWKFPGEKPPAAVDLEPTGSQTETAAETDFVALGFLPETPA